MSFVTFDSPSTVHSHERSSKLASPLLQLTGSDHKLLRRGSRRQADRRYGKILPAELEPPLLKDTRDRFLLLIQGRHRGHSLGLHEVVLIRRVPC